MDNTKYIKYIDCKTNRIIMTTSNDNNINNIIALLLKTKYIQHFCVILYALKNGKNKIPKYLRMYICSYIIGNLIDEIILVYTI